MGTEERQTRLYPSVLSQWTQAERIGMYGYSSRLNIALKHKGKNRCKKWRMLVVIESNPF